MFTNISRKLLLGVVAGLLFTMAVALEACAPTEADIDAAMERLRSGYVTETIERLEAVVEADPEGPVGDRAALILGNLLVQHDRPAEALEPLRRAVQSEIGPIYARLLLARAVIKGELAQAYPEAVEHASSLQRDDSGKVSPILRREATLLLAKLYSLQGRWQEAASFGEMFLKQWSESSLADEARWVTAEAQRESGRSADAHALYATIWYESPASPWALESRDAMQRLESSARLSARRLSDTEHYEFIQALRSAGLHEEALEQIATLLGRSPRHARADGALFMKAMSLYTLRQNNECVQTVKTLRSRHPRSSWLPAAGIYAIRAWRRSDNTREIRRWVDWIVNNYRSDDKAIEALYNLGSYYGNVVGKEEGLEVLKRVVREGGQHPVVKDALWRSAWLERNLGRTSQAVATLGRLLDEHPESGYRKAALYWSARFLVDSDRGRAIAFFQTCLDEFPNHYYGHQSLEQLIGLGVRPRRTDSGLAFPAVDHLDDPNARPGSQSAYLRAIELKSIGLYELAAAELESMPDAAEDLGLQFALADLYSRSGNTWEAAASVRRHFKDFVVSGSRDPDLVPKEFWHIVYPFNYRSEIEAAIKEAELGGTRIDPYLIAALIRMESHFLPTAISPAGAVGLMQLMPYNVERLAEELGLGQLTRSELFNPRTNIRLGTYYLAQRVEEFDGGWFPAICSYNAGAGPTKKWWREKPADQPLDEFIENIPYGDTRLYLKQILGDYQNYEWIYPEEQ